MGLPPRLCRLVDITFGNDSDTYPTNGIPLTLAGLGFRTVVSKVEVIDSSDAEANTHSYTWDAAHNSIRCYSAEATEFSGTTLADTTLRLAVEGF